MQGIFFADVKIVLNDYVFLKDGFMPNNKLL